MTTGQKCFIYVWNCIKITIKLLLLIFNLVILLLFFLDEPNVTLSETCGGEVRINNLHVCSSHWNLAYSHIVCLEQNCSDAVSFDDKLHNPDMKYHHVSCEHYHDKLGQCNRFKGKCNGGLVSVYCVGEYVNMSSCHPD